MFESTIGILRSCCFECPYMISCVWFLILREFLLAIELTQKVVEVSLGWKRWFMYTTLKIKFKNCKNYGQCEFVTGENFNGKMPYILATKTLPHWYRLRIWTPWNWLTVNSRIWSITKPVTLRKNSQPIPFISVVSKFDTSFWYYYPVHIAMIAISALITTL